jgi:hypothetical protein
MEAPRRAPRRPSAQQPRRYRAQAPRCRTDAYCCGEVMPAGRREQLGPPGVQEHAHEIGLEQPGDAEHDCAGGNRGQDHLTIAQHVLSGSITMRLLGIVRVASILGALCSLSAFAHADPCVDAINRFNASANAFNSKFGGSKLSMSSEEGCRQTVSTIEAMMPLLQERVRLVGEMHGICGSRAKDQRTGANPSEILNKMTQTMQWCKDQLAKVSPTPAAPSVRAPAPSVPAPTAPTPPSANQPTPPGSPTVSVPTPTVPSPSAKVPSAPAPAPTVTAPGPSVPAPTAGTR